jgi:hypothetical protein
MDRKLARTLVALNVGYLIGISVYIVHGFNKIFAESEKDVASMEYANHKISMKILDGGYNGMTTEEIEEAVKQDFEVFRMEARLND